ncbi:MAG: hypothetical protein ACRCSF_13650, partial [Mycobacteriaceae bacterium]
YIVSTLLEIRRGEHTSGLRLQNLTLNQAIETAILGLYIFSIPAKIINSAMPSLYGASILFSLGLNYGPSIVISAAKAIQKALSTTCIAQNIDSNEENTALIADVYPNIMAPEIVDMAQGINIASPSCPAVADFPIGRAVDRAVKFFAPPSDDPLFEAFSQQAGSLKDLLNFIRVPALLAQPQQSSDIGGLVGLIDDPLLTYLFGIGASSIGGHLTDTIALSEVSLLNLVDYLLISSEIAWMIPSAAWSLLMQLVDTLSTPTTVVALSNFIPDPISPIKTLTDYPINWYKGIIQSVCLSEDEISTLTDMSTSTPLEPTQ